MMRLKHFVPPGIPIKMREPVHSSARTMRDVVPPVLVNWLSCTAKVPPRVALKLYPVVLPVVLWDILVGSIGAPARDFGCPKGWRNEVAGATACPPPEFTGIYSLP